MTDITITKLNESVMKVFCKETSMELDIQDTFTFEVPNAKFDPRVRRGVWDGLKKLYNRQNKKLPIGLLYELLNLCDKKKWAYTVDPDLLPDDDPLTQEDLLELVNEVIKPHSGGNPIEPYEYQLEAVLYQLNMGRTVSLAATSSGKSLMIYLAVRIYQLMDELQHKTIFITVPSISLVEQLYNDFKDYSTFEGSGWHVNQYCQKVTGKHSKTIEKQIVITTWQSMQKLPYDEIEGIGAIFVDETHSASAKILGQLIEQATHTPYKHGLTGTLDGCEANEMYIQGILGPAKRIITAKEIIDTGRASEVNVNLVVLNYNDTDKQELAQLKSSKDPKSNYNKEVNFINSHQGREDFLFGMIEQLEGNTLVLFTLVEDYGKPFYEKYSSKYPDTTYLITGDVDSSEREDIRTGMENETNSVIFASIGTMAVGISIKNLHNLVLISSSKSKIRSLQSIGRLMRKHKSKDSANIFDIVDDLTYKNEPNYVFKHASTRLDYYKQEQFNLEFINIDI